MAGGINVYVGWMNERLARELLCFVIAASKESESRVICSIGRGVMCGTNG